MKIQTAKFQTRIEWRNDAVCNSVDDMVAAAKMGMDCGLDQTIKLMPANCFHSWVKYCYTHTKLYNRDRPANASEMLCIIRMVLFSFILLIIIIQITAVVWTIFNRDQSISSVRPLQRTMRRRRA